MFLTNQAMPTNNAVEQNKPSKIVLIDLGVPGHFSHLVNFYFAVGIFWISVDVIWREKFCNFFLFHFFLPTRISGGEDWN